MPASIAALVSTCSLLPTPSYTVADIPPLQFGQQTIIPKDSLRQAPEADVLALNPAIIAYMDRYVDRRLPALQRVWVLHSTLRSKALLGLEYRIDDTFTASETFNQRSANCVGYSNLFIALARHYGLDARYQLVERQPQWSKKGQVIARELHMNTLVNFNNGQVLEVDINSKDRPVGGKAATISDEEGLALYYNNLGVEALITGDLKLTVAYFARAIEAAPDNPRFWSNLGSVYRSNNQLEAAQSIYHIALSLDPNAFSTLHNLAVLYQHWGRDEERRYYMQRTETLRQRNPYYHVYLAREAQQQMDIARAIEHLLDAIALKDDDPEFQRLLDELQLQLVMPAKQVEERLLVDCCL